MSRVAFYQVHRTQSQTECAGQCQLIFTCIKAYNPTGTSNRKCNITYQVATATTEIENRLAGFDRKSIKDRQTPRRAFWAF